MLLEPLEGEGGGEVHHVGAGGVDEVGYRVVRAVEHLLDVGQLEEDHQPDDEQRIVGRADVLDVMVHLVGDDAELREPQGAGPYGRRWPGWRRAN